MSLHSSETEEFSILVVCAGNLCRSPIAEQLLRTRFAAAGVSATITSAGLEATEGEPMDPMAAGLSRTYGGDPEGKTSVFLKAGLIANADLVLTATREQRAQVARMLPRSTKNTFTIKQFARMIEGLSELNPADAPTRADSFSSSVVTQLAATRGFLPPLPHPEDDDIEDPYRQSQATYDRVGKSLDAAVTTIVSAFVASPFEGAFAPR
jgi:protein-tyrosine phosphatase